MNHTSLEIFSVVAEELSISKAAKRLGRVQSNITTRIQLLEEELDVQLFTRENRRLKLSPQGKKFLSYSKKILSLAEEARQSLHPDNPIGKLAFGSMECTAASRLADPLVNFTQSYPQVKLSFITLPTRQLTEKVQNLELDCALVALPKNSKGGINCPDELSYQPLFIEELVLLLPAGINLTKNKTALAGKKLAAFMKGCTYREIALAMLEKLSANGSPIETQEVGSYHSMLACVASGHYFCLLPQSVLDLLQLPEGLTTLPAGSATTHFIWRTDSAAPALDNMRQTLMASTNIEPG